MLSPGELTGGSSAESVSVALKRAARNAPDRMIWIEETADACRIAVETFKGYFYGKNAPTLDNFRKIVAHLGATFASDVLRPAGVVCIKADDAAMIFSGEAIRAIRSLVPILEGVLSDAKKASGPRAVPDPDEETAA